MAKLRAALALPAVALGVLLGNGGCAGSAPPPKTPAPKPLVRLALSLKPGAQYDGELVQTQELPTGQEVKTTAHVRTRVVSAEGAVFTLEDRYDDIRIAVAGQAVERHRLEELQGVRIRYQLDHRGRLIGEPTAEGTTEDNRSLAEALAKSVSQASVPFPEQPIAVGGAWEGSRTIDAPTGLTSLRGEMREVHRLERIDVVDGRRWAVISIQGRMELTPLDAEDMAIRGKGTLTGEQRVLLADGFTSDSRSEATLELTGHTGHPSKPFSGTQRTGTRVRIAPTEPHEKENP